MGWSGRQFNYILHFLLSPSSAMFRYSLSIGSPVTPGSSLLLIMVSIIIVLIFCGLACTSIPINTLNGMLFLHSPGFAMLGYALSFGSLTCPESSSFLITFSVMIIRIFRGLALAASIPVNTSVIILFKNMMFRLQKFEGPLFTIFLAFIPNGLRSPSQPAVTFWMGHRG